MSLVLLGLDTSLSGDSFGSDSSADLLKSHASPTSFLSDNSNDLIWFVMEWRDRGMPVTCFALIQKATQLKLAEERPYHARAMVMPCFMNQHYLMHWLS
jgi:hypothetical protein